MNTSKLNSLPLHSGLTHSYIPFLALDSSPVSQSRNISTPCPLCLLPVSHHNISVLTLTCLLNLGSSFPFHRLRFLGNLIACVGDQQLLLFLERSLCGQLCSKPFTIFNRPMKKIVLLSAVYEWANQGTEQLSSLCQVIKLAGGIVKNRLPLSLNLGSKCLQTPLC